MLAAIHDTLAAEMARDERVDPARRGHRPQRWRVPRHRRAARPVRRLARVRHTDLGVGDHRRERRSLGGGPRAGGRDPVRRLQPAGVPPDRRAALAHAVPQPEPFPLPGHRALPLRRRRAHARAPRRLGGGAVHAHARAEGRGAVDRGRRQGPARQRGARPRSGAVPRAHPAVPHRARRGSRR